MTAKPRKTVDDKLADLNELYHQADDAIVAQSITTALADRNNRVVAKAAIICEEKLLTAYQRLLKNAAKTDAHCTGKTPLFEHLKTKELGFSVFVLHEYFHWLNYLHV